MKTLSPSSGCQSPKRIASVRNIHDYVDLRIAADSGNGSEAALIGDCRLFRSLAENQPQCLLGLLQHNPSNGGRS
jgi:hypothetical protein